MMNPLSKIYQTLKYYREILELVGLFVPGIAGILILKYTSALNFIQYHSDFDRILMLIILLFLEGFIPILLLSQLK